MEMNLYVIQLGSIYTSVLPSLFAFYTARQFDNSYLRRVDVYNYENLCYRDPDIVVYETVERYLKNLMTFSVEQNG